MPCGIACQRRLIRMDIQLFFPDQLRTNLLCFLLEGSVICFQKLHGRLVVQASNFAFDHAAFRNDVGTGAAADFPMLAVVLSSTWPCGSCAIAWAAAWMLLMPSSGWKPAWAAFLGFSPRRKRVSVPRRRLHRSRRLNPERMLLLPAPGCSQRHLRLCSTAPHQSRSGFRSGGAVFWSR